MQAHKVEPIKRILENATGLRVPSGQQALACLNKVRPKRLRFRGDGYTPNNPQLSLLYYRQVITFDRKYDPASVLEVIFELNDWGQAWRNGITILSTTIP